MLDRDSYSSPVPYDDDSSASHALSTKRGAANPSESASLTSKPVQREGLDDIARAAASAESVVLLTPTGPRVVRDPRRGRHRSDAEVAEAIVLTGSERGAIAALGIQSRRIYRMRTA